MNTGIIRQLIISLCLRSLFFLSSVSQYFSKLPGRITSGQPRPLAIDPMGGLRVSARGRVRMAHHLGTVGIVRVGISGSVMEGKWEAGRFRC